MKHIKNLCKGVEDNFRKSAIGDSIIQTYRMFKAGFNIADGVESGYTHYVTGDHFRTYPNGTGPSNFAEPEAQNITWIQLH